MLTEFQSEIVDFSIENLKIGEISQFTIDLAEDLLLEFGWNHRINDINPITRDEIGSKRWEISNVLEIINPALEKDIEILTRAEKILKKYQDYLELPENRGR